MDILVNVLISLGAGVVSSLCTFIILNCIKPKISVSSFICKRIENGIDTYRIKIVNNSKRNLKNVHYSLEHRIINKDGNAQTEFLAFNKAMTKLIFKYDKNDKLSQYALRLSTIADLSGIFEKHPKSKLLFTIFAEHSTTSTGVIKIVEFDKDCIKDKTMFEQGKSLKFNSIPEDSKKLNKKSKGLVSKKKIGT